MSCISTVSYSIQINGHKTSFLHPLRGIKQEDPLSPYLFLICAEGLSHLLKNCHLQDLKISKHRPTLTHFLFTNNTIIYVKALSYEIEKILVILNDYARANGQSVNFSKSSIFFNPNTPSHVRCNVARILHVNHLVESEKF